MRVQDFITATGADFFAGVPDSQLKALCDYLTDRYGVNNRNHLIAANEGNCVGAAAGYYLATGKVPLVYLQNSGEGNIVNPVASLLNNDVYGIPVIFVIGWRGEPGVHDEPQHAFQGRITTELLETLEIGYQVIDTQTTVSDAKAAMERFRPVLGGGGQVAFVVKKGALEYGGRADYHNDHTMTREQVIEHVTAVSGDDPIIATTGKTSRELFELREKHGRPHTADFLTVGSMGHASSIALGIALQKPDRTVWVTDGDGAFLMHMGAAAVIGAAGPRNLIHIVINNGAHESVGGQPTAMRDTDIAALAKACGYKSAVSVSDYAELDTALRAAKSGAKPALIEAKCAIGSRSDLGRPTLTPAENKAGFMDHIR